MGAGPRAGGELVVDDDTAQHRRDAGPKSLDRSGTTLRIAGLHRPPETPDPGSHRQRRQDTEEEKEAVEQPVGKRAGIGVDNVFAELHVHQAPRHAGPAEQPLNQARQAEGQRQQQRRDAKQQRDTLGLVGPAAEEAGHGIVNHALLPDGPQHVSRAGTAGASCRAIVALVA